MDKVRLLDVAFAAGVSPTAVSFVVNGKSGVSSQTRCRIFETMDALGYVPKKTLELKKQNKHTSKTVLILNCSRTSITRDVFPNTPFFSELLKAFDEKLSESGYHFWIKSINIDERFSSRIHDFFANEDITCVLLIATDMLQEDVEAVLNEAPQTIVLDTCLEGMNVNCVVMDNYLGGALAARHAVASGHRRIGYLQSKERIYNFDMRKKGFFTELAKNGLSVEYCFIWSTGASLTSNGELLQEQFRKMKEMPTYIFAENDYMALGALQALKHIGVKIPEEVSIIGFDNIDTAGISTPGLSTIDVSKVKLAEFCISQIKRVLKDPKYVTLKQFIEVKLIKRETTTFR